ncbi:MAG: carbohydrate binding family 9 domain-containing protein, partial [Gemmatimonadota bacterium]|nr:carbohydrate binding family 9 domain-containing protein [Gemmatimonadota bacterium]
MTTAPLYLCAAMLAGMVPPIQAGAQSGSYPTQPAANPAVTPAKAAAVRIMRASRAATPINIDGKLNDPAWSSAVPSGDFTQSYPKIGAPPTDPTEVRVLYDDDALYIGVRMLDARPDSIAAQLARRDASGIYSDWLHVVIDSYHDRRNAFRFSVNPRGVQKDVLHSDDRTEDLNWDAVWQVATTIDSLGWTAEYRIPFSQLRFGAAGKGVERLWGIQVQRDIARRNERDSWSPWKQTDPGYVSFSGDLGGIIDIPTPRRLEIMPYASTKLTRAPGDPANPFYRANDAKPSVGADLKYGLPSGLILTATINPDFGQVEVDPAVVNLSAYETFFPEKRPFFVEGASIFNIGSIQGGPSYGSQQIFYSRRIGRSPQRFPNGVYVDAPDATTIFGAGKLTGKVGAWTVGVLNATTGEEKARVVDAANVESTTPVEPLTNYFVGRIRRDFRGGSTILNLGGTAVNRDLSDTVFKDLLRSNAEVGSADFEHRWKNRVWTLTGALSKSRIAG